MDPPQTECSVDKDAPANSIRRLDNVSSLGDVRLPEYPITIGTEIDCSDIVSRGGILNEHIKPPSEIDESHSAMLYQDIKRNEKSSDQISDVKNECPNGGWGWVCVFGCSLIHMLIGGYGKSYGLIYTRLIEKYHSSAALTAWVNGSSSAVRMGLS